MLHLDAGEKIKFFTAQEKHSPEPITLRLRPEKKEELMLFSFTKLNGRPV